MTRILIIEPDKLLAKAYAVALEHEGYQVDTARSGQVAAQLADARKPDCVVLELQLAPQDGVAFLHEFRSYADWRTVPVIVQTAIPPQALEPVQASLQTEFGVVACLYKPTTSLPLLLRTVRQTLRTAVAMA